MSALPKDARACSGADPNRIGDILTFAEKKRARGMLADKQGVGSIAEELECSIDQIQTLADAKPKSALSSYMFFARDNRESVAAEVGTTDPKVVSKAIGEKWAAQSDKSPWERQSEQDKKRFERENAVYTAALDAEAAEEQAIRDTAASRRCSPA